MSVVQFKVRYVVRLCALFLVIIQEFHSVCVLIFLPGFDKTFQMRAERKTVGIVIAERSFVPLPSVWSSASHQSKF